jgi:hypothetical protein
MAGVRVTLLGSGSSGWGMTENKARLTPWLSSGSSTAIMPGVDSIAAAGSSPSVAVTDSASKSADSMIFKVLLKKSSCLAVYECAITVVLA